MTTLVSRNVSTGLCYHVCHSRSPNLAGGSVMEITRPGCAILPLQGYGPTKSFVGLAPYSTIRGSGALVVGEKSRFHQQSRSERNRLFSTSYQKRPPMSSGVT